MSNTNQYEICVFDSFNDEAYSIGKNFNGELNAAKAEADRLFESGKYFGVEVISLNDQDADPIKYILTQSDN